MEGLLLVDAPPGSSLAQVQTSEGQVLLLRGETVLEVSSVSIPYLSIFSGDKVLSGNVLLATPIDPLFLVREALERARCKSEGSEGRFCDLDQISDGLGPLAPLRPALESAAAAVCDVKEVSGQQYYRLNDDRLLAWLMCKAERAAAAVAAEGNEAMRALEGPSRLAYGAGLVGEYLPAPLYARLLDALGLEAQGPGEALATVDLAAGPHSGGSANKRPKLDPKEIARERAKEKAKEKKEEEQKKQAKGHKPLTAFFMKK